MTASEKTTVQTELPLSDRCSGCTGCSALTSSPHVAPPEIKVTAGINARHQHGVEYDQADLLVITKVLDVNLGPGPMAFDANHSGVISQAITTHNFRGAVGEHLDIELPSAIEGGRPRHVVVIGTGKADDLTRRRMCDLFNYSLALACRYKAQSLLIPVFPYRSSADALNLRGTGAILRCLVDERARRGTLGVLQEVRLLCTPQAKKHLEAGLAVDHTLCTRCRLPDLE